MAWHIRAIALYAVERKNSGYYESIWMMMRMMMMMMMLLLTS